MLCALKGEPGDVYNIGSGKETSIAELASAIISLADSNSKIVVLPKRSWDNSGKRFASVEKSERILGFTTDICLEDGLKKTIYWTKENMDRINACIHKHDGHMKQFNRE